MSRSHHTPKSSCFQWCRFPFTVCPLEYKLFFTIIQMFSILLHRLFIDYMFCWLRLSFTIGYLGFHIFLPFYSVNKHFLQITEFFGVISLVSVSWRMITKSKLNIFMVLDRPCHVVIHMVVLIDAVINMWGDFLHLNCPWIESFLP